jgi:hypothetical protein
MDKSTKRLKKFFEEIERGYQESTNTQHALPPTREEITGQKKRVVKEAVVRSQIKSPEAQKTIAKSRSGHKDVNKAKIAALSKVMSKDFHMLSPEEKKKVTDRIGFGDNEVGEKVGKYEVVTHSKIHPDVLFAAAEDLAGGVKPAGQVFIYDRAKKEVVAARDDPLRMHSEFKSKGVFRHADRGAPEQTHGRVIRLYEPYDHDWWNVKIPEGTHLALWTTVNKDELDRIIETLPDHLQPDFVHVPDPLEENPEPEKDTKELLRDLGDMLGEDEDEDDIEAQAKVFHDLRKDLAADDE